MQPAGREVESILAAAVEMESEEQRRQYVAQACAGDADLQRRVEELIENHFRAGSFLESPAADLATTVDAPLRERPGTVLGPYKLLEQLGEGGFGVVFLAEQTQPVRRKVALKVLKPGMDTGEVVARFEAERQALALMDHPNIAHVYDGGETATGRPYFVMELVQGVPLTAYCDQHRLDVRARLRLFVSVCQAVQHAHQKGIIHRDLKPNNILATQHDGKAVVKVIDFGIAKALGQPLIDKTLHTGFGQVVGTPLYMSPEQAQGSGLDVDTRSDIYSLGVVLYELLTGTTPLARERLNAAGYDEICRLIREEEPPRPSTRLHKDEGGRRKDESKPTRGAGWRRFWPYSSFILHPSSFQELDWVVMKALEKDRNRRYESASAFAADVQRYLADEPVQACPPSALYRLRKFVRRHKGAVLAASLIVLVLVAGSVGTTTGLVWALAAEQDALTERDAKDKALQDAVAEGDKKEKAWRQTLRVLNTMTDQVIDDLLGRQVQLTEQHREFLRKVLAYHAELAAARGDTPEVRQVRADGFFRVGRIRYQLGEYKDAERAYRDALALQKPLAAAFPGRSDLRRGLAACYLNLGILLSDARQPKDAAWAYGEAVALYERLVRESPSWPGFRQELALGYLNLGIVLHDTQRPREAEVAYRKALGLQEKLATAFPDRLDYRYDLATTLNNLSVVLRLTRQPKEAEEAALEALRLRQQLVAAFPGRPDFRFALAQSQGTLGNVLKHTSRPKDAQTLYGDARVLLGRLVAEFPGRPDFRLEQAHCLLNLGDVLRTTGPLEDAQAAYDEAVVLLKRLALDYPGRSDFREELGNAHTYLGNLLRDARRPREAEAAYREAIAVRQQLTTELPHRPDLRRDLADSHVRLGGVRLPDRPEEAEEAWQGALAIQEKLAADYPNVSDYQNDLAGTLVNLAFRHNERRDFAAAVALLERARPHHQAALKAKPTDATYRQFYRNNLWNLARSYRSLADHARLARAAEELAHFGYDPPNNFYDAAAYLCHGVSLASKDARLDQAQRKQLASRYADQALALLQQAVEHGYKDAARFPTQPQFRRELAECYVQLGNALNAIHRPKDAEAVYREARVLQEQLISEHPKVADYHHDLAGTLVDLAILEKQRQDFAAAVALLEEARPHHEAALAANAKHPTYRHYYRNHLWLLADCRLGLADHVRLAATADELARFGYDPANDTYNAACFLSRCVGLAQRDAALDEARRKELAKSYAERAMALLRQAIAHGYRNAARMKQDSALEPLRGREEYETMLAQLEEKARK
jgi:serine/threonine protein kinase